MKPHIMLHKGRWQVGNRRNDWYTLRAVEFAAYLNGEASYLKW